MIKIADIVRMVCHAEAMIDKINLNIEEADNPALLCMVAESKEVIKELYDFVCSVEVGE